MGIFLVLFIASLVALPRLQFQFGEDQFINPDLPMGRRYLDSEKYFEDRTSAYLILQNDHVWSPEELCRLKNQMTELSFGWPELDELRSFFDLPRLHHQQNALELVRVFDPECKNNGSVWSKIDRSPWARVFSSADHRDVMYSFSFHRPSQIQKYGLFNPFLLDPIKKDLDPLPYKKIWFGPAQLQRDVVRATANTQYLNFALVLVILSLFRRVWRSWKAGLIFIGLVIVVGVLVHGCIVLFGDPYDTLTQTVVLLLVIACLEDFVFLCNEEGSSRFSWHHKFRRILVPSFFTSLTTTIGFGSLLVSQVQSIRSLGFYAALGAMIQFFVTYFLLPALGELFPSLRNWTMGTARKWPSLKSIARPQGSMKFCLKAFYLVAALVGLLLIFHQDQIQFGSDLQNLFISSHPNAIDTKIFEQRRGWLATASLNYRSASAARIQNLTRQLAQDPEVLSIESPELMADQLTIGETLAIRDWARRELANTTYGREFRSGDRQRVRLFLRTLDSQRILDFEHRVRELCKSDCELTGPITTWAESSAVTVKTLFQSFILSFALVILILIYLVLAIGNKNLWAVLFSSLWGPLAVLAVLYFARIRIDMVLSVLLAVLAGLTGDNAIQFLFSRSKQIEHSLENKAPAAKLTMLMMVAVSLCFLLTSFTPLRTFGLLMSLGFLLSYVGDVWVFRLWIRR